GALLGLTADEVLAAAHHADDAFCLAAVGNAGRRTRSRRRNDAHARADAAARRLGAAARRSALGRVELDAALLKSVVAEAGYDLLVFGELGIDRVLLRSVLRECQRVETTIAVESSELVITYVGPKSRGRIRLRLEPPLRKHEVVHVPLDLGASACAEAAA
ncbi:MAG: hypothetical protein H5U40_10345, partial [Polyangiaceae bacterium]|nr:hypothetical protein [Polyangiaceae bacterium]